MFNKFKKILKQNFSLAINSAVGKPGLFLIFLIFFYVLIFSFFSLWKYYNFQYNAMDLAIINQVFYNSANGDFFVSSIHPPSYLGDHFSPILFLLLPLYFFYQEPQTLLIFQTIILALCAWPIFLISREKLNGGWALFLSFAWLANPFVHNINLFEFSFLPFAVFFIFWAFYFYQKEKFILFLIFCLIAMIVREDVALVVFMFCPLAFIQKRKTKWIILPAFLSIAYFFMAIKATGIEAPAGQYKFLIYYSWLGETLPDIIKNIIFNPILPIFHVFKLNNFLFFLALLLPVVFLPIFAPLNLLLGLGIFLQLILRSGGGSETLLQTHYASLIFPAIFISAIYGLKKIKENKKKNAFISLIEKYKSLSFTILAVGVVYSTFMLSPIFNIAKIISKNGLLSEEAKIGQEFLKKIPKNEAIAADYNFLTPLSSRKNIYSLNYIFLKKQQFLTRDYYLPNDTQYLIFNYESLITYQLQYGKNPFYQNQYDLAKMSWEKIFDNFGLIKIKNGLALYQKGAEEEFKLVENLNQNPQIKNFLDIEITPEIKFLGFNQMDRNYQMFWEIENPYYSYQIKFIMENKEKIYPFVYGLTDLKGIIKTNYYSVPSSSLKLQLIKIEQGGIEINDTRGTKNVIDKQKLIGPEISLINL